jgi:hypothetical protein
MTSPDMPHTGPRRLLPALAGMGVAVLLVGAVIVLQLTAAPSGHTGNERAADEIAGVSAASLGPDPSSCLVPPPLTAPQVREAGRQPGGTPTALRQPAAAGELLRRMAGTVAAGACDRTAGRYDYVQMRTWVLDSSRYTGTTGLGTGLEQSEHWPAANGSGRATSITSRTPAADNPPTDDTYPPGHSLVDPAPLPADPGLLAARLDGNQPLAAGPQPPLRALADLTQRHTPGQHVRAAVLAVLADTDGLASYGTVRDRAGRPGVAVAVTSCNGAVRDLIILDARTGDLLAYEQAALRDPGKLGITEPAVLQCRLYVARTHTATVRQR